jgi:hypothetical protein
VFRRQSLYFEIIKLFNIQLVINNPIKTEIDIRNRYLVRKQYIGKQSKAPKMRLHHTLSQIIILLKKQYFSNAK